MIIDRSEYEQEGILMDITKHEYWKQTCAQKDFGSLIYKPFVNEEVKSKAVVFWLRHTMPLPCAMQSVDPILAPDVIHATAYIRYILLPHAFTTFLGLEVDDKVLPEINAILKDTKKFQSNYFETGPKEIQLMQEQISSVDSVLGKEGPEVVSTLKTTFNKFNSIWAHTTGLEIEIHFANSFKEAIEIAIKVFKLCDDLEYKEWYENEIQISFEELVLLAELASYNKQGSFEAREKVLSYLNNLAMTMCS